MSFQLDPQSNPASPGFGGSPLLAPDGSNWTGTGPIGPGGFGQPNVGVSDSGTSTAAVDGRTDKPTPLSRWYATVSSLPAGAAMVELDDDSDGRSTITVTVETTAPSVGQRVIVDFRPDGLAVISAVVA